MKPLEKYDEPAQKKEVDYGFITWGDKRLPVEWYEQRSEIVGFRSQTIVWKFELALSFESVISLIVVDREIPVLKDSDKHGYCYIFCVRVNEMNPSLKITHSKVGTLRNIKATPANDCFGKGTDMVILIGEIE